MHDVLGIEFEVEPGTTIGNHARGKQEFAGRMRFALVMVEEDTRRTMHLRDDHPLGAVDHKSALDRHQGHVAHVDVLLLDVADRARARILVNIPDHEAQRNLQRSCEGHAALLAFLDVVLRFLEFVIDELKLGLFRKITDREYGFEYFRQPHIRTLSFERGAFQELLIGTHLNLNEVRHGRHFENPSKVFTDTFATGERLRH